MPVSMPGVVLDLGFFQSGQEPGTTVGVLARTRKNDIGGLVWWYASQERVLVHGPYPDKDPFLAFQPTPSHTNLTTNIE
jgi:hypothetical protein